MGSQAGTQNSCGRCEISSFEHIYLRPVKTLVCSLYLGHLLKRVKNALFGCPPPTYRLANSCRTVHILNSKMAFSTHFDRWPEYNECSNVLNGRGRVFLKRNFKHRPQKICAPIGLYVSPLHEPDTKKLQLNITTIVLRKLSLQINIGYPIYQLVFNIPQN